MQLSGFSTPRIPQPRCRDSWVTWPGQRGKSALGILRWLMATLANPQVHTSYHWEKTHCVEVIVLSPHDPTQSSVSSYGQKAGCLGLGQSIGGTVTSRAGN
ncbi:hypothetical protein R1flu_005895 [Riccia fluitans]|uniref:Uncharacterized protein n=1 Tax=Riccia fluitans TaxID=41844 RepID=A0ABD1YV20_9MARC